MTDLAIWADAQTKQREYWHELAAWVAANLMNMWRGKNTSPITPAKLLGKKDQARGIRAIMAERRKQHEDDLIHRRR